MSGVTITTIYFYHIFVPPKRNQYSLAVILHPLTSCCPRQPLIYFLSLYICLFLTFHMNGIIEFVVFRYFIPLYCQIIFHCMNIQHFIYILIS